jgi:uncharacterized protein (DUF433 family)
MDYETSFDRVWQLFHRLEGEVVSTFASRKRYRYKIVRVKPGGVVRRAEQTGEWASESLVGRVYFQRTWERLAHVGVCDMEDRHAGFVAACFSRLPELDLWYANTGKGWDYRTLVILGDPASRDGVTGGSGPVSHARESSRVVSDPKICSGTPTIKGTRIMVGNILGMFHGGANTNKILEEYPWLSIEDVEAALEYSRVEMDREQPVAGS